MIDEHKRQLGAAQKEAAAAMEALRAEHKAKEAELQRQVDYVRKTAEAEAARIQRRSEAEMADLRATISRLEVDLMKVCAIIHRLKGCSEITNVHKGQQSQDSRSRGYSTRT